jgi:ketosteroid isomerase-like protein
VSKSVEERLRLLEDREEIARLKARYCNFNDGGWPGQPSHHFIDEVMALFVADAVWDGGPGIGVAEGRENIRALFITFKAVPFVVHNVMNPLIDVDGDTARAQYHAVIPGTHPGGQAVWTFGYYDEQCVRTPQGWRYQRMKFTALANSPYELGWSRSQFGS